MKSGGDSIFPHRRLNPLTGDWVLVSPHRATRPWQGQVEPPPALPAASYDPACYLCPGNSRAGGHRNPPYQSTFVFDNDFAAMLPDDEPPPDETLLATVADDLLVARHERGLCRVVCFSPDHSLTLSRMSVEAIGRIVAEWTAQYLELGSREWIRSVQIFENRGEMMGASNPHPHGQIWASESVPNELAKEAACQLESAARHGGEPLLLRYLAREIQEAERVVLANEWFVVLVPYWAVWPFETLILPRRHVTALDGLSSTEARAFAQTLRDLTAAYDRLFQAPFPYSMGLHQRPTDGAAHQSFTFHTHFYPPLLRSATVRKFMVGFEMLGSPQRDITPEAAAASLRTACR